MEESSLHCVAHEDSNLIRIVSVPTLNSPSGTIKMKVRKSSVTGRWNIQEQLAFIESND